MEGKVTALRLVCATRPRSAVHYRMATTGAGKRTSRPRAARGPETTPRLTVCAGFDIQVLGIVLVFVCDWTGTDCSCEVVVQSPEYLFLWASLEKTGWVNGDQLLCSISSSCHRTSRNSHIADMHTASIDFLVAGHFLKRSKIHSESFPTKAVQPMRRAENSARCANVVHCTERYPIFTADQAPPRYQTKTLSTPPPLQSSPSSPQLQPLI